LFHEEAARFLNFAPPRPTPRSFLFKRVIAGQYKHQLCGRYPADAPLKRFTLAGKSSSYTTPQPNHVIAAATNASQKSPARPNVRSIRRRTMLRNPHTVKLISAPIRPNNRLARHHQTKIAQRIEPHPRRYRRRIRTKLSSATPPAGQQDHLGRSRCADHRHANRQRDSRCSPSTSARQIAPLAPGFPPCSNRFTDADLKQFDPASKPSSNREPKSRSREIPRYGGPI